MKYRILIPLYLFFWIYRFIFWGLDDLMNITLNALNDTVVSFYTAVLVYRLVEFAMKRDKKILLLFSLLIYGLSSSVLWLLHYIVYDARTEVIDLKATE